MKNKLTYIILVVFVLAGWGILGKWYYQLWGGTWYSVAALMTTPWVLLAVGFKFIQLFEKIEQFKNHCI